MLKNTLIFDLNGDKLESFYILPRTKLLPNDVFQPVRLKIVHFHKKDDFYNKWKLLKNCLNPLNRKNIWLNEPLLSVEAFLKQYADELNLITATKNCNASILCYVGDREVFLPVKTIKDIHG